MEMRNPRTKASAPETLQQQVRRHQVTLLPNLLLDAYHDLGLSDKELALLLHLLRCHDSATGSEIPASDYLMEKMRLTRTEVNLLMRKLQEKGLVIIREDLGRLKPHEVSLQALFAALLDWESKPDKAVATSPGNTYDQLVKVFENQFRGLNDFEYERLREWLEVDSWPPDVIQEALRVAALGRSLSFRYIDRVLLNWQIKGLRTLEEVRSEDVAFGRRRLSQLERATEAEASPKPAYTAVSRSPRSSKKAFRIGNLSGFDESEEERKKRFARLSNQ
jgi:DNA replication protein